MTGPVTAAFSEESTLKALISSKLHIACKNKECLDGLCRTTVPQESPNS